MKTSVIIPCYKYDEYLEVAIDSVLNQTRSPLEIIVVDDGSPIPLRPILSKQDRCPIVWIRTPNQGPSGARNSGVSRARGEYIAFLDADDAWEPRKLELQETFLEAHQECVGCYTMCIDKPGFFKFGPYPDYGSDRFALARHLWRELFFPPSCVLLRRSHFMEVGGFPEGITTGEDLNLWIKLLQYGSLGFISEPLCWYRQHSNQSTGGNQKRILGSKRTRKDIIDKNSHFLEECGIDRTEFWDAYRNDVLIIYFKRDFESARPLLADYLKDHPCDLKLYLYLLIAWFVPVSMMRAVRS